MLSALAPSGPVAPPVPTSPPSTTDHSQPVQRESFKDVYRDVPGQGEPQRDAGQKQNSDGSTVTKTKKSSDDGNDKTAVTAIPSPYGVVLQKAPLAFALPSLGQELAAPPVADDSTNTTNDQPHSSTSSSDDSATRAGVPNFSLPLAKAGQAVATALVPAGEKLAFSARLTQPDTSPNQTQAPRVSTAPPSRSQTSTDARTTAEPASPSAGKDAYQTPDIKKAATPEAVLPPREISSASAFDLRQPASPPQSAEPVQPTSARNLAIQDVQPALPELPKAPASTEILLQLAGQNQSTASVRVVDRAGTVNVTVHAADPDLRTSLRSNLSDLASQLTGQGYKTEMIKPAVIAANADNQHDSRQNGRDGSSQQHHLFTPDGRHPQRDRRANSERWNDELAQETSGTAGAPGGNS